MRTSFHPAYRSLSAQASASPQHATVANKRTDMPASGMSALIRSITND
ncbi:hypothetical protein BIFANG_02427 [Bifidobacterium angulatum DSM 20098 = JCM 7096]|uniref:Uncharacterized protein n=1 Tax=Bifidobacterium angulatum DSM 20098 = JCM 7096 TaxID=518635 RepID=C4FDP0_9BIFI|nr:hypothetical protein BIFANG_02427 [Bifidobacterium angulatum DSM 20098 = JCM 7096]